MKKYICLLLIGLLSCKQEKNIQKNRLDQKTRDEIYEKVSHIPDHQLTKIEIPEFIDLDTIEGDQKNISFTIKNKGGRNLTSFVIKPPCSCNELSKYDSIMLPHTSQNISVNMKFNKVGNFYEGITLYGSFYPYMKKVYVEGFRRK